MRTIIVYYSMGGNTAFAAETLAARLGAETLRLEPVKAYPDSGARKFLWGGKSAVMGEKPALKPYDFDASAWDRVILGFPVWASLVGRRALNPCRFSRANGRPCCVESLENTASISYGFRLA